MQIHIKVLLVSVLIAAAAFSACERQTPAWKQMDASERLMNTRPDSALAVLDGIPASDIKGKGTTARYALLKSMALDKNYIDTTTFDVLQPAIDYYVKEGTPDEKLKTLYYQGRIYQNKGDEENAMLSFINAREVNAATDTLTLAHLLVAQGTLYLRQYKVSDFVANNLQAAKLYGAIDKHIPEVKSYTNAIDGYVMMDNKEAADSILFICIPLVQKNPDGEAYLFSSMLAYTMIFGSDSEIKNFLDEYRDSELTADETMNFAQGYAKIGEYDRALKLISSISPAPYTMDSLKYASVKIDILEKQGNYEQALKLYKDYSAMLERYQSKLLSQDLLFVDQKHQLEMDVFRERTQRERIVWIAIGAILLLIIIYQIWVRKLKIEHENDLLKIQTLQQNLFESGQKQNEAKERIQKLFQTRFQLLDGLASSYFESKETGQEQKRIFAEVKESINNFSSDETITELSEIVNGYNNGVMDRFRADFPRLSKSRFRFALYLFCGFSLPSISIFTGMELRNVYVHKSRLKSMVSGSDSPYKAEYLRYFE